MPRSANGWGRLCDLCMSQCAAFQFVFVQESYSDSALVTIMRPGNSGRIAVPPLPTLEARGSCGLSSFGGKDDGGEHSTRGISGVS